MTAETITIRKLRGATDALLHIYPGQQGPQDCFIALDLRDGSMWSDYDAEIGNAIPFDVYHGIVRRYPIPVLRPETVNALMDEIAPYAAQVVEGSEIVWDGHNHVGQLSDAAIIAEEHIAGDGTDFVLNYDFGSGPERYHAGVTGILFGLESDVYWTDAEDWIDPVLSEIKQSLAAGKTLDALYDEIQGDGTDEDSPVVQGLYAYLERLAEEVV